MDDGRVHYSCKPSIMLPAYIRTRCSADMMQNSVELWKIHRMRNGGVHVGHSHGWCRVPSVMVWSWCCSVQELEQ